MNVIAATSFGGHAFGRFKTRKCVTLYLALEDHRRRLQTRAKKIFDSLGLPLTDAVHFKTSFPRFGEGGLQALERYVGGRPETKLVIIDTLARVRGIPRGGRESFSSDYLELGELQQLALRLGIAILVIHHTTKAAYADEFDSFSGTTAVTAAADTLLSLVRDGGRIVLSVRGRDVDESQTVLTFDGSTGLWTALGDAFTEKMSDQRRMILAVLPFEGDGLGLKPKAIAEASRVGYQVVRQLVREMLDSGHLVQDSGGYYYRRRHSVHTVHATDQLPFLGHTDQQLVDDSDDVCGEL